MRASLAAVAGCAVFVLGCSTYDGNDFDPKYYPVPAGCPSDYDCDAGQTCWSNDGKNYSCMPSGPAPLGGMCVAIGPPSCSDGLDCYAVGESLGTCEYWCDPQHPCPKGTGTCTSYSSINGVTVSTCIPDAGVATPPP